MRGSQLAHLHELLTIGIIPAHAGLTQCSIQRRPSGRDHPRACGAHFSLLQVTVILQGSSPRMRGSHGDERFKDSSYGIIPAHAGLTLKYYWNASAFWDHPRACGAHQKAFRPAGRSGGSSPRMRGSRCSQCPIRTKYGIIPAHAGLTRGQPRRSFCRRDHPRACGAHFPKFSNRIFEQGSSPRMRGSPIPSNLALSAAGIIPAHAGLTPQRHDVTSADWDHPRACGAHWAVSTGSPDGVGSSPRMRGSHYITLCVSCVSGIIPAHAGLTRFLEVHTWIARDHPRACGAHVEGNSRQTRQPGSSPRMRGSLSENIFST